LAIALTSVQHVMSCLFCSEDDDDEAPSLDDVIASGMRTGRLQLATRALKFMPLAVYTAHAAAGVPLTEIWLQDNELTALDLHTPQFDALAEQAQLIYLLNNRIGGTLSGAHLARWSQLQEVNLSGNAALGNLPAEVSAGWQDLRQLYLNDLPLLTDLPDMSQVLYHAALIHTRLIHCFITAGSDRLRCLPYNVSNVSFSSQWPELRVLHCNHTALRALPDSIGSCTNLAFLSCSHTLLEELPASIGQLQRLEKVYVQFARLRCLPEQIGSADSRLARLYLNHNCLVDLPESLTLLGALEELYVNDNRLAALPAALGQCTRLTKLYVGANCLRSLPSSLGALRDLDVLHCNRNELEALEAASIGGGALKFLHVAHNRLARAPWASLRALRELRVFEADGNAWENGEEAAVELAAIQRALIPAWTFDSRPANSV
jgi:leucine-rich repeat protein SHOC2